MQFIDRKTLDDFEAVSCDWKTRSRGFAEQLQSGDVFEAADVLKKLTFLSHEKKLSFRNRPSRQIEIPDNLRDHQFKFR
jgi:RNA polymerase-interacting CarD/CdnL/TRCF family regulator